MTPQYIQPDDAATMERIFLQHREYNLDKKDNLASIPTQAAIYAICGRVNGQPANARFVGATANLQAAIQHHYTDAETDDCLKTFMRSIKSKELLYRLVSDESEEEIAALAEDLKRKFRPACTEEMNQVF